MKKKYLLQNLHQLDLILPPISPESQLFTAQLPANGKFNDLHCNTMQNIFEKHKRQS